jgi:hypothetical protein
MFPINVAVWLDDDAVDDGMSLCLFGAYCFVKLFT